MKSTTTNKLKEQYEKLEVQPSVSLWNQLETQLNERSKNDKSTPKPTFGWWKYAATILLLISLGSIAFKNFIEDENKNTDNITSLQNQDKTNPTKKTHNSTFSNTSETANQPIQPSKLKVKLIKNQALENQIIVENFQKNKDKNTLNIKIQENKIIDPPILQTEKKIAVTNFPNIENVSSKETIQPTENHTYIQADELLFSREFTRNKNIQNNKAEYVEIDLNKIKKKLPSKVKILGITVYSDSLSID